VILVVIDQVYPVSVEVLVDATASVLVHDVETLDRVRGRKGYMLKMTLGVILKTPATLTDSISPVSRALFQL
jgi:hypothetical protein